MFEACIKLNCYGYYDKLNNFCLHCKVAVECYDRTKEMEVKVIEKLIEV